MLPRRLRLSRSLFRAGERGRRAQSEHFSLVITPLSPTGRSQGLSGGCAAVISKKVARRSVDRHLLKRRMLSVMLPWCHPSFTLIVYARAGSHTLPFRALSAELSLLLSQAMKVA